MAKLCIKVNRTCKLVIALITVLVAIFDLGSDWYVFDAYVRMKESSMDTKLTIAMGVLCALSTFLFVFEIRNGVNSYRLYASGDQDDDVTRRQERRLEMWIEAVTFSQTVLEDFPITVLMYITFNQASCQLFMRVFEFSFTGNLAVLGAFVSSLWKVLSSCGYCCCGQYKGCSQTTYVCWCCALRTFRFFVSILLLGISAYLFFNFNRRQETVRSDCFMNSTALP